MTFLDSALAYADKLSVHIFPLAPKSKVPDGKLAPRGFLSATLDPKTIRHWWARLPEANIGVACSLSGFVVLDIDPRNGGDDTMVGLVKELGPLPDTWTCLTPTGGVHYYLTDCVGDYIGSLGAGVDVKYRGYVVAPPSVHPNGSAYRWDVGHHPSESKAAPPPPAWLDRMTKRVSGPRLASTNEDARDSFLGAAFEHLGWLGDTLFDGKRMVRCPWLPEHSDSRGDGRDSSTVLFPRAVGRQLGGFRCAHGHCALRTWQDVLRVLPQAAKDAGKTAAARFAPPSIWDEAS